jgi:hypothetical protein
LLGGFALLLVAASTFVTELSRRLVPVSVRRARQREGSRPDRPG